MPFPFIPLIGAAVGAAGTWWANKQSAKEAQKNRDFQERMSSTAHQREVEDMVRAGINPILSAHGSGASSPGGSTGEVRDMGTSARSGAELLIMKKQAELLEAQTADAMASDLLKRTQAGDLISRGQAGAYDEVRARAQIAMLDLEQRKSLLPLVLEQAKAEIAQTQSAASAARARAALDEAARTGAINEQEFQELIGTMGPAMQFFFQLMRAIPRR